MDIKQNCFAELGDLVMIARYLDGLQQVLTKAVACDDDAAGRRQKQRWAVQAMRAFMRQIGGLYHLQYFGPELCRLFEQIEEDLDDASQEQEGRRRRCARLWPCRSCSSMAAPCRMPAGRSPEASNGAVSRARQANCKAFATSSTARNTRQRPEQTVPPRERHSTEARSLELPAAIETRADGSGRHRQTGRLRCAVASGRGLGYRGDEERESDSSRWSRCSTRLHLSEPPRGPVRPNGAP